MRYIQRSVRRGGKIEYNHFIVDRRHIPVPPMKAWQDKNVLPICLKPIIFTASEGGKKVKMRVS